MSQSSSLDFVGRLALVGIFLVENVSHVINFTSEVDALVSPALGSAEMAKVYHFLSVFLGLVGSAGFILGSIANNSNLLRVSRNMLLAFLLLISFVWWVKRDGVWFWEAADWKVRQIHLMKNMSIAGGIVSVSEISSQSAESATSALRRVFVSTRPWSLPATLVPCLVVLSSLTQPLDSWVPFARFVFGVVCLQAASNLFNSFSDFVRSVDTKETSGDRTLVDGFLTPRACFQFGSLLGLIWLATLTPYLSLILLSAAGGFLAVTYSLGALPLKFAGLGDLAVFLAFGPLLASAAALTAGGAPGRAVAFVFPTSLLVVAILHANNIRDLQSDEAAGAKTLAVRIGRAASLIYFDVLVMLPFLGLAVLAGVYVNPGVCLGALALPQALALTRGVRAQPVSRDIPETTAQTMVVFGVCQALGTWLFSRF